MLKLFEPIRIGHLELKNRIVFPPMTTGYEEKGSITRKSINFYKTIAQGGAGLIVVGDVSSQPTQSVVPALYDDCFTSGFRQLTDAVHASGAGIAAQIFHQEYDMAEIMAAMRMQGKEAALRKLRADMRDFCNRLTAEQIQEIQDRFVTLALRARKAGFDMIQIHGDRLIGMFSSPIMNRRSDAYGGSLENRARFALEVTRKIRAALPDMPLDYKLAIIRTNPPMGKAGSGAGQRAGTCRAGSRNPLRRRLRSGSPPNALGRDPRRLSRGHRNIAGAMVGPCGPEAHRRFLLSARWQSAEPVQQFLEERRTQSW